MNIELKHFMVPLVSLLVASTAYAGGRGDKGRRGPPRTPPPEAVDACDGKSEGDSCSVDTPHGTLDGECRNVPSGELACVPDGHPPPPRDDD